MKNKGDPPAQPGDLPLCFCAENLSQNNREAAAMPGAARTAAGGRERRRRKRGQTAGMWSPADDKLWK